MAEATAGINIAEIEAQISAMSPEELAKALTELKVKQKVATKKYYNPENAKKLRQKKAEEIKAMVAKAKALGLYDKINEEAGKLADAKLAADESDETEEETATA